MVTKFQYNCERHVVLAANLWPLKRSILLKTQLSSFRINYLLLGMKMSKKNINKVLVGISSTYFLSQPRSL